MGTEKKIEATWRTGRVSREELLEGGFTKETFNKITKYDLNIHPYQTYVMCAQYGSSLAELAELFRINVQTLRNWIESKKEMSEALRNGRDAFNVTKIEKALVSRALGYEYEEITVRETSYKKRVGKDTVIVPVVEKVTIKKQLAPDVEAIKFFLKNRSNERWRDVQASMTLEGKIGEAKASLKDMSTADILKLRNVMKEAISEEETKQVTNC